MKNFLFVLTVALKLMVCVALCILAGLVATEELGHFPSFLSWPLTVVLLAACPAMFWPEFRASPLYVAWEDSLPAIFLGILVMVATFVLLSIAGQITSQFGHRGSGFGVPLTLGLVAGVIAGLFYELYLRPQKSSFSAGELRLVLEPDAVVLTAIRNGTVYRDRIPFGHLLFEKHKQTQTRMKGKTVGARSASVSYIDLGGGFGHGTIHPALEGSWVEKEVTENTGQSQVRFLAVTDSSILEKGWCDASDYSRYANTEFFIVSNSVARSLGRWIWAHKSLLLLDEKKLRREWEAKCKAVLAKTRSLLKPFHLKSPIEVFEIQPGPKLRYVCVGRDGTVCVLKSDGEQFDQVDLSAIQVEDGKFTVTMDGRAQSFKTTPDVIAKLKAIQLHAPMKARHA
jgi:hypothetical protein